VALLNKVADSKGVASSITRGEALVGHVEEGEETLLLDDRGDFFPLLLSGVYAGRIVRAGMEKDNATRFCVFQVFGQASPVELDPTSPAEVAISTYIETRVTEGGNVVAPGWVREVNCFWTGEVACEEDAANTEGASSRDALGRCNL